MVSWPSICFFLVIALLKKWHTCQFDFILAYTQANIEMNLYMEVPKGFVIEGERSKYALKLLKNLYGQKQASLLVWNQHLMTKLIACGFAQSHINECVFYFKRSAFLVFTDDTILMGPDTQELDKMITLLRKTFQILDEGTLNEYLGIKIHCEGDDTSGLMQPQLIDSILDDQHLTDTCKKLDLPYLVTKILHQDLEGASFNGHFDYRLVVGKLLYLEKSTRPELWPMWCINVHDSAQI